MSPPNSTNMTIAPAPCSMSSEALIRDHISPAAVCFSRSVKSQSAPLMKSTDTTA